MRVDLPDEVHVEKDGPVRVVVLNRPDSFNAANAPLHRGVAEVWRHLARDRDARAVVLTGAGGAFCAGGDLNWLTDIGRDLAIRTELMAEAREVITEMVRFPLPVIAAVNGPAVGFGCSIALLCDVVFMADGAFLADPHVAMGLTAGDGGPVVWPLLTSLLKAKEFLLTGDKIPAREAERLGLANRVVAGDSLRQEALALAHRMAALPPHAVASTKRALNLHLERAMVGVMDFALAAESESFATTEHREQLERWRDRSRVSSQGKA